MGLATLERSGSLRTLLLDVVGTGPSAGKSNHYYR